MNHKNPFTRGHGTLKAIIIYDDVASAARASAALQRAVYRAKVRIRLDIKPWRVDVLKLPQAAHKALIEAVDADLMVLTGSGAFSGPDWLTEWLEYWGIRRQEKDSALLVICDEAGGGPSAAATAQLSRFALRNSMEFIVENNPLFATKASPTVAVPAKGKSHVNPARESALVSSLTSIKSPYRHWGINE